MAIYLYLRRNYLKHFLLVTFLHFLIQNQFVYSQNIVAPSASPTALIEVLQPAGFAGKNRIYINALTGSSMVLECQIYNKPLTSIVWTILLFFINIIDSNGIVIEY